MIERIARIRGAYLGWEDHGIFTCELNLDYGGSSQIVSGYALDRPKRGDDGQFVGRCGTAFGMEFVIGVMKAAGVND